MRSLFIRKESVNLPVEIFAKVNISYKINKSTTQKFAEVHRRSS